MSRRDNPGLSAHDNAAALTGAELAEVKARKAATIQAQIERTDDKI